MTQTEQAFTILGKRVKERVSKLEGIATAVSFDLYGCVQVLVNHGIDDIEKPTPQVWYDMNRMEVLSDEPIIAVPVWTSKEIRENIKLLGLRFKDLITGIEGIATTVSFELYGAIEGVLTTDPDDSKNTRTLWASPRRFEEVSSERVMPLPNFIIEKGPAEKPVRERY